MVSGVRQTDGGPKPHCPYFLPHHLRRFIHKLDQCVEELGEVSIAKVFVFGLAVALAVTMPLGLSAASAKAMKHTMKLPPGACAFEKKAMNAGTICSYQCNAQTNWCGQQLCVNGALNQVLPCFGPFCAPKCAG
jgi:hypothetical protein